MPETPTSITERPSSAEVDAEATGTNPNPASRFRRILLRLLFALLPLCVVDLVLSLTICRDGRFLRWILPPYSLAINESLADQLTRPPVVGKYEQFDPVLGWSIRAHGRSPDGLYQANAAGIRASREYAESPPAGVLRIAAFGDSYTHCDGVRNHESWPHLLEQTADGLEVLNFGVFGYGTDQAFLRYQQDGVRFKPDIVLIGLMVENIMRNVSVYRPAYQHESRGIRVKPRFTLDGRGILKPIACPAKSAEQLFSLVRTGDLLATLRQTDFWVARAPLAYEESSVFLSSFLRITYGLYENYGRDMKRYYGNTDSEPFQVTAAILREFHRVAILNGARRAVVLIFPDKVSVQRHLAGERAAHSTMIDLLQEADVPVIDLTEAVAEAVATDGVGQHFARAHYTPDGNVIVATAIASALATD